ncbi:MAG: hypothetical protein U9N04_03260 [Patescibacteria group bacterium]|nr:hypothetical protein [Patescibacteria group bacterium]
MPDKKESLQNTTVKTFLAVLLFAGMGTIIIGGGYIIGEYSKNVTSDQIIKPINQETENYYDLLKKKCAGSSCCLSSFEYMKKNNYKEADENYKCPDGFKAGGLRCESSLNWCEPMEETESEVVDFKVESHQTFSYDGGSMAMDCKFLYGEVRGGKFESKKLLVYFPDYTTYPNYLKLAEYIEKDITIKVFLTNNKSILRNKFDEIYGENYGGEFPYYCLEDEDIDNSKKNDYAFQKIFALKMPDEENQSDTSDWQTYRNEELGFEFQYQSNDKITTRGNQNYVCLEKKDTNGHCRCYIYINFFHILDEEYHESYNGETYDNLEEYIEYTYSVKRRGRNENDYIVKMERVKNDESVNILEVIIGDEATDYSRKEYYIDYDDTIYGNYKNGKDYLTISRDSYYFDDVEKEKQFKQFNQILSTFKFIEN